MNPQHLETPGAWEPGAQGRSELEMGLSTDEATEEGERLPGGPGEWGGMAGHEGGENMGPEAM